MRGVRKVRKDKKQKEETKYEKSQEIDTSEIQKLTDDCLIEIFQHLVTIADKVRIERVCKRWQNLSQRSWNTFKSLDFSAQTWGIQKSRPGQLLIQDIDIDKILRLSGTYLTSISIDVAKFAQICHLLPNIRELQLVENCLYRSQRLDRFLYRCMNCGNKLKATKQCTYNAWKVILSWLMSNGKNITSFRMNMTHSHYKEEDFVRFLRKMTQLKTFHLYTHQYLDWSGTFLLEFPFDIIQDIILRSKDMRSFDNNLSLMIRKCKKLQTFGIERQTESEIVGVLQVLPLQAAALKNFKLKTSNDLSNRTVLLSTMSTLTYLNKLDLSGCNIVNDEFIEVIAKNCKKLTYLDLNFCIQITDRGIQDVCINLQKLTYLDISFMLELKNPPLKKLSNLVVLRCYWNTGMTEKCLCSILENAHQLRALDVQGCRLAKDAFFNVAVEVAKTRNVNSTLDLYVSMNVLDEKPPLLNIMDSRFVSLEKYGIDDPFLEINNREV